MQSLPKGFLDNVAAWPASKENISRNFYFYVLVAPDDKKKSLVNNCYCEHEDVDWWVEADRQENRCMNFDLC